MPRSLNFFWCGNYFALAMFLNLIMQVDLLEFEELGLNDRLHLLGAVGVFITRVMTFNQMYVLYTLYGFYVEMVISYNGKATKVSQAVPFKDCNRLNKYLKQIDLSELGI